MRLERSLRAGSRAMIYSLLVLYAAITLFPFFLSLVSSFKDLRELYASALALPGVWRWENYRIAWIQGNFSLYFKNSVYVTGLSIVGVLLIGSMASYILARYAFPGRTALSVYFLAGLVIPFRLAVLPVFVLLRSLHLFDTLGGLILVYIAADLSFAIFILTNYFRSIPREIEEAAVVDGAGPFRIYFRIMLPLVRPALATVGIVVFVWVWNDFFLPLVFLQTSEKYTLILGLFRFFGRHLNEWQYVLAGANITLLPVILLYLFASGQFIEGLTAGVRK
ncbi:carbohydrate ABC transporter permease [Candidatus Acetothermia bacterium]|nr:MAG: carbohydrate ABC transporter permease [Candidatus Acetothermia bacterium]